MKKYIYSILAIVALSMMFSCQKPEENTISELKGITNVKTFKAVFPSSSADTKVFLDDNGKTGWEIGDVITIHGKATDELKTVTLDGVTNTISADKKTATFTVALDMTPDDYGSDGFYAAYPNSAFAEYESNRTRWFNCFNNTNTLLLSGVYDGVDSFIFYNVSGALSFIVDGTDFGGFDEYIVVGKNDEVIGFDHYNTRVATGDIAFYHYSTTGAKKSIRASVIDDGVTPNYVYFPVTEAKDVSDAFGSRAECVDFTNGFYIIFLKEGVYKNMVSVSSDVRIERQSLLPMGDITTHVKAYVEPEHHSSIKGATDLSASQANCYIISAAGAYKFPARKGNSNESIGTVKGVEILWETYNNAESVTKNSVISKVDYEGSEIFFETPATLKPGNALIIAKDADENILWSWHIWIPQTTIETIGDYSVSKKYFMDRNLGALVVTEANASEVNAQSFGLLYQWGRKDPFVGARALKSEDKAKVAGELYDRTEDTSFDITASYAHPNTFAKFNTWRSDVNEWNPGGEKSIDDPCPIGYKVPEYNSSELLWGDVCGADGFEASSTYGWWKLGAFVFPMAGYSESGGGISHAYDRSRIFSNAEYSSSNQHAKSQYIYDNSGTWTHVIDTRKRYGASVRCAKIDGEVPEPPQPAGGHVDITIDGNMSDWDAVTVAVASSNSGPYYVFKATFDDTYIYLYSKRNYRSDYWNNYAYFYYYFDLDNDTSTKEADRDGLTGLDEWIYLYMYGGTNDAPAINTAPDGSLSSGAYICAAGACAGVIGAQYVETELRIPRADIGVQSGKTVKIYSKGNKSADNIISQGVLLAVE